MLIATSSCSSKPPFQIPTLLPLSGLWYDPLHNLHKLCTCTRSAVIIWITKSGCLFERTYWILLLCRPNTCTRSVLFEM